MTTTEPMLSPWRWAAIIANNRGQQYAVTGHIRIASEMDSQSDTALDHVRRYLETAPQYCGFQIKTIAVRNVAS